MVNKIIPVYTTNGQVWFSHVFSFWQDALGWDFLCLYFALFGLLNRDSFATNKTIQVGHICHHESWNVAIYVHKKDYIQRIFCGCIITLLLLLLWPSHTIAENGPLPLIVLIHLMSSENPSPFLYKLSFEKHPNLHTILDHFRLSPSWEYCDQ